MQLRIVSVVTVFCGAFLMPPTHLAAMESETLDWIQNAIETAQSPAKDTQARIDAAGLLRDKWRASLPTLIEDIDAYYRADIEPPFMDEDVPSLLPLISLVKIILRDEEDAIEVFRKHDTDKTVKLLAWATNTMGDDQRDTNLRSDATVILASVVDNSTLCIVLDQLRDPELTDNGVINLVQVATPAAGSAYEENFNAIQTTTEILRPRVERVGAGKTYYFVSRLLDVARTSPNRHEPLPPRFWVYCQNYDYRETSP